MCDSNGFCTWMVRRNQDVGHQHGNKKSGDTLQRIGRSLQVTWRFLGTSNTVIYFKLRFNCYHKNRFSGITMNRSPGSRAVASMAHGIIFVALRSSVSVCTVNTVKGALNIIYP